MYPRGTKDIGEVHSRDLVDWITTELAKDRSRVTRSINKLLHASDIVL